MKTTTELRQEYNQLVMNTLRDNLYKYLEANIPEKDKTERSRIKEFFEERKFKQKVKTAKQEVEFLKQTVDKLLTNKNVTRNILNLIRDNTDHLFNLYNFYEKSTNETDNQIEFVIPDKKVPPNPNRITNMQQFKDFLEENKKNLESETDILKIMDSLKSHGLLIRSDKNKSISSLFTSPLLTKYYRSTFPIFAGANDALLELRNFKEINERDKITQLNFLEVFQDSDDSESEEKKYNMSSLELALSSEMKNIDLAMPIHERSMLSSNSILGVDQFKTIFKKIILEDMKKYETNENFNEYGIKAIVTEEAFAKIFQSVSTLKEYLPGLIAITNKNILYKLKAKGFREKQGNLTNELINYRINKKLDMVQMGCEMYELGDPKSFFAFITLLDITHSEGSKNKIVDEILKNILNLQTPDSIDLDFFKLVKVKYPWLQKFAKDFSPYENSFNMIQSKVHEMLDEREAYLINQRYNKNEKVFGETIMNSKSITFNMDFMRIFLNENKTYGSSKLSPEYSFPEIKNTYVSNEDSMITLTVLGNNINLATDKEMTDIAIDLGKLYFKQIKDEDLQNKIRELQLTTALRNSELSREMNNENNKKEYIRKKI